MSDPALPTELRDEIASTGDGNDITQPWVSELKQPPDTRLWSANDWGVYDRIRKDDQVKSVMEQRIRALVSRDWGVRAGDDTDPRSVEAADKLKANLQRLGWDRVTEKMAWAVFNGYGAAELLWEARDGLLQWSTIKVRHARRFRVDKDDLWRLITPRNPNGAVLSDRKFWFVTTGATNDDQPYGEGLADWLYWPTNFKRNGIRFWNIFLDKFGSPTAVGKYRPGTAREDINKLLQAMMAIATETGIAIPEGMAIELLEASRSGTGSFPELVKYMDGAIAKIVLSQTMTTDAASTGLGSSQADVHDDVKLEVVKADADLLSDGFNTGPARWWTDLNYGPDVAAPEVWRDVEEETDRQAEATTDQLLSQIGWRRTEESFKDTYGEGYERAPPTPPPVGARKDNPAANEVSASFAEGSPDVIDQAVASLIAAQGFTPLTPLMAPIADAVSRAGSPDELDSELISALGQTDVDRLLDAIARAGFAVRVQAETGEDA